MKPSWLMSATICAAVLVTGSIASGKPVTQPVSLSAFSGQWTSTGNDPGGTDGGTALMTRIRVSGNTLIVSRGRQSSVFTVSRREGRRIVGRLRMTGKTAPAPIPASMELSGDGGFIIILLAPPESEYDVSLLWKAGYKPRL